MKNQPETASPSTTSQHPSSLCVAAMP